MSQRTIRNFSIIAHVDHGKSTLADRLLEMTGTVPPGKMHDQFLDQNPIERERGITIKMAPVSLSYQGYTLNLIDTPGHVDFSYEVSRSLAAVEGVILLVDGTQGIEAQTLSTLEQAKARGLSIVPAITKIDRAEAKIDEAALELAELLSIDESRVLRISGKTGQGVAELLQAVIKRVPMPSESVGSGRALVFDSAYDDFRGVILFCRVFDGSFIAGQSAHLLAAGQPIVRIEEVGVFKPDLWRADRLSSGEIGYVSTGLKTIQNVRVGDTLAADPTLEPLSGYQAVRSLVFASFFPLDTNLTEKMKSAIERIQLTDSSLLVEPIRSKALGQGFQIGFLGLLHLDIIRQRIEREFDLSIIVTLPKVDLIEKTEGQKTRYLEPWAKVEIVADEFYLGSIYRLMAERRAVQIENRRLPSGRIIFRYEAPIIELFSDLHDQLKSQTKGFGSLSYEFLDYRPGDLKELKILLNGQEQVALSQILPSSSLDRRAKNLVSKLKDLIPRQLIEVRIQAMVEGKIVSSERISPLKKDVTAKLYGGDVTRKRKLLEKQKRGKKRMAKFGSVELPGDIFLKIMERD